MLHLTGPATLASIRANVWCAIEGLGERVPVRLISGADRQAIIEASYLQNEAKKDPLSVVTLSCNRRLPASASIQLVYGRGIVSAANARADVKTTTEQRLDFTVREPFSANFTCERENARSGCVPILPLTLNFNSPVATSFLKSIRLTEGTKTYPATLVDESGTSMTDAQSPEYATAVQFSGVLPENTEFMIELPLKQSHFISVQSHNRGNARVSEVCGLTFWGHRAPGRTQRGRRLTADGTQRRGGSEHQRVTSHAKAWQRDRLTPEFGC